MRSPEDVLRWAYESFPRVVIVASLQAESSVLIDMASRIRNDVTVLTLDTGRHLVSRSGRPIRLTPKEFGVLRLLMAAQGRALSVDALLDGMWEESCDPATNSVRVTIASLRGSWANLP